eukprot:TRINITY_DN10740_c0_g1_i1.p1 TRINITY_DN10740_c0_g1~~TRINITY_DN10740_c0_g1_i1.p1  ORF type:complete len:250 (-),score=67.94 TRINITY_DN10740_c0_g1_i1:77-826(-)
MKTPSVWQAVAALLAFGATADAALGKESLRLRSTVATATPTPLESAGRNAEMTALRARGAAAGARAVAGRVRTRLADEAAVVAERGAQEKMLILDKAQYTLTGALDAARRSAEDALSESQSAEAAVANAQMDSAREASIATEVAINDVKTRMKPLYTELKNWEAAEMAKRIPPPPRAPWQGLAPEPLPFQAVQSPPAILLPPGSPLANPQARAAALAAQGLAPAVPQPGMPVPGMPPQGGMPMMGGMPR